MRGADDVAVGDTASGESEEGAASAPAEVPGPPAKEESQEVPQEPSEVDSRPGEPQGAGDTVGRQDETEVNRLVVVWRSTGLGVCSRCYRGK